MEFNELRKHVECFAKSLNDTVEDLYGVIGLLSQGIRRYKLEDYLNEEVGEGIDDLVESRDDLECVIGEIKSIESTLNEIRTATTMDYIDKVKAIAIKGDLEEFWIEHKPNRLKAMKNAPAGILLETLNGPVYTNEGDWIITGVNGEQYPCDPEIFKQLYDELYPVGQFRELIDEIIIMGEKGYSQYQFLPDMKKIEFQTLHNASWIDLTNEETNWLNDVGIVGNTFNSTQSLITVLRALGE